MTTGELEATVEISASEYETLKNLQSVVDELKADNERLSGELQVLLNRLFRKKSERIDPSQLQLFLEQAEAARGNLDETPPERRTKPKATKGHGRGRLSAGLPREVVELDVPEKDRACPDCGKAMASMGADSTERVHVVPAQIVVREYRRPKYGCPDGHAVKTAELPPTVIDKGKYEASVYAHVAVAKYADHLPLNRLEGIFKRNGIPLKKSMMWDMILRVGEIAAMPILAQMREELRAESILHADETPVTVRLEDRKGSKKAYIWCYGREGRWVFDFTMTRERDGPNRFLRDWSGALLTDGYSGYDEAVRTNDIRRGGCWAHARRKAKEALDTGAKGAVPLLRAIGRLFWIERAIKRRAEARELDRGALRAEVRPRLGRRALARIDAVVQALRADRATLPKSQLGKALTYIENQWQPLTLFLDVPELEIHNNDAERALRHVVVGKKNWLFFGSERGGRVGAAIFSLIAACKAIDVDPERYLEDVLVRVDTTPASEVHRLTPWAWAAEKADAAAEG